jgi:hypothetical protein
MARYIPRLRRIGAQLNLSSFRAERPTGAKSRGSFPARRPKERSIKEVAMPVILSQRTWHEDAKYLDREGVIYHYPPVYRTRVTPYDRFIYYRPATGALPEERSTYVGHGVLGVPFEDPYTAGYSYVPVTWYEPFRTPVPLAESRGIFYETEDIRKPQFQSAVRSVRETAYYRILALGGVSAGKEFTPLVTTETVVSMAYPGYEQLRPPKDILRAIDIIPEGTGYVPRGRTPPNVCESAALQERARKDHQWTLELIRRAVVNNGGACWYNNNIDLLAKVGERKFLIEAKSLNDPRGALDRMRYGIGQLLDYRVRYRAEIENAEPVLAFGARPAAEIAWIATILQENRIGFVANSGERIISLNDLARQLPFASPS